MSLESHILEYRYTAPLDIGYTSHIRRYTCRVFGIRVYPSVYGSRNKLCPSKKNITRRFFTSIDTLCAWKMGRPPKYRYARFLEEN